MKKLLKIHGNCEWYHFKQSQPEKMGDCSNKGMADLRKLRMDPTGQACEHFRSVEK